MSASVHTVEGRALTPTDRSRVAEFNELVHASADLPAAVREGVAAMLELVADGRDVDLFDTDSHLSPNEAARLVGVSRPLLNQLLDEGHIPFFETSGGHRKIKSSAVRAYVGERDVLAAKLAEARSARKPIGEEIAEELGLDAARSKRLGFT